MVNVKKKKCYVCRKNKPITEFPFEGKAIRCNECKKKSDENKKPGYFGL